MVTRLSPQKCGHLLYLKFSYSWFYTRTKNWVTWHFYSSRELRKNMSPLVQSRIFCNQTQWFSFFIFTLDQLNKILRINNESFGKYPLSIHRKERKFFTFDDRLTLSLVTGTFIKSVTSLTSIRFHSHPNYFVQTCQVISSDHILQEWCPCFNFIYKTKRG